MPIIFNDILGVKLREVLHSNDGKSQNEKNGQREKKEKSKKDKTMEYLSQIDKQKRDQLYEIYKHDFEMFDYDPYRI